MADTIVGLTLPILLCVSRSVKYPHSEKKTRAQSRGRGCIFHQVIFSLSKPYPWIVLCGLLFCTLLPVYIETWLLIHGSDFLRCASASHWSTCLHLRRKRYDFHPASNSSHIEKVKAITLNARRKATWLLFPWRPWIIRACCSREHFLFIRGGDLCKHLLGDCSFWPWKRSVTPNCKTRYRIFRSFSILWDFWYFPSLFHSGQ